MTKLTGITETREFVLVCADRTIRSAYLAWYRSLPGSWYIRGKTQPVGKVPSKARKAMVTEWCVRNNVPLPHTPEGAAIGRNLGAFGYKISNFDFDTHPDKMYEATRTALRNWWDYSRQDRAIIYEMCLERAYRIPEWVTALERSCGNPRAFEVPVEYLP